MPKYHAEHSNMQLPAETHIHYLNKCNQVQKVLFKFLNNFKSFPTPQKYQHRPHQIYQLNTSKGTKQLRECDMVLKQKLRRTLEAVTDYSRQ